MCYGKAQPVYVEDIESDPKLRVMRAGSRRRASSGMGVPQVLYREGDEVDRAGAVAAGGAVGAGAGTGGNMFRPAAGGEPDNDGQRSPTGVLVQWPSSMREQYDNIQWAVEKYVKEKPIWKRQVVGLETANSLKTAHCFHRQCVHNYFQQNLAVEEREDQGYIDQNIEIRRQWSSEVEKRLIKHQLAIEQSLLVAAAPMRDADGRRILDTKREFWDEVQRTTRTGTNEYLKNPEDPALSDLERHAVENQRRIKILNLIREHATWYRWDDQKPTSALAVRIPKIIAEKDMRHNVNPDHGGDSIYGASHLRPSIYMRMPLLASGKQETFINENRGEWEGVLGNRYERSSTYDQRHIDSDYFQRTADQRIRELEANINKLEKHLRDEVQPSLRGRHVDLVKKNTKMALDAINEDLRAIDSTLGDDFPRTPEKTPGRTPGTTPGTAPKKKRKDPNKNCVQRYVKRRRKKKARIDDTGDTDDADEQWVTAEVVSHSYASEGTNMDTQDHRPHRREHGKSNPHHPGEQWKLARSLKDIRLRVRWATGEPEYTNEEDFDCFVAGDELNIQVGDYLAGHYSLLLHVLLAHPWLVADEAIAKTMPEFCAWLLPRFADVRAFFSTHPGLRAFLRILQGYRYVWEDAKDIRERQLRVLTANGDIDEGFIVAPEETPITSMIDAAKRELDALRRAQTAGPSYDRFEERMKDPKNIVKIPTCPKCQISWIDFPPVCGRCDDNGGEGGSREGVPGGSAGGSGSGEARAGGSGGVVDDGAYDPHGLDSRDEAVRRAAHRTPHATTERERREHEQQRAAEENDAARQAIRLRYPFSQTEDEHRQDQRDSRKRFGSNSGKIQQHILRSRIEGESKKARKHWQRSLQLQQAE